MSPYSYDVGVADFQQRVIDASRQVPVVIDFWAEWCGPCRALKPILEKLAEEYQGKFLLAKIDSDKHQELATQFGVRGIPSVKAVRNGEVVDEFSGALPEAAVREFLERLIPSPAEELRQTALAARDAGDPAQALQWLAQASKLAPKNEDVRLDAAEILLGLQQLDDSQRLLASLAPETRARDRAQRLLAQLNFAREGRQGGDEAELRDRIAAAPDDMAARQQLANLLIAGGRYQQGLDELLEMVRLDRAWNDAAARKAVLAVFSLLGGQGELVASYRRKLASLLN